MGGGVAVIAVVAGLASAHATARGASTKESAKAGLHAGGMAAAGFGASAAISYYAGATAGSQGVGTTVGTGTGTETGAMGAEGGLYTTTAAPSSVTATGGAASPAAGAQPNLDFQMASDGGAFQQGGYEGPIVASDYAPEPSVYEQTAHLSYEPEGASVSPPSAGPPVAPAAEETLSESALKWSKVGIPATSLAANIYSQATAKEPSYDFSVPQFAAPGEPIEPNVVSRPGRTYASPEQVAMETRRRKEQEAKSVSQLESRNLSLLGARDVTAGPDYLTRFRKPTTARERLLGIEGEWGRPRHRA